MDFDLLKGKEKTERTVSSKKVGDEAQETKNLTENKIVEMQKVLEEIKGKMHKKIKDEENKIKELIRQKKKKEAIRQVHIFKAHQNAVTRLENMIILMEKQKIELDTAYEQSKMIKVLEDVKDSRKETAEQIDNLEDILLDQKEIDQPNKEVIDLLNELAQGNPEDPEEIENMFKDFEQEILDSKMLEQKKEEKYYKEVNNLLNELAQGNPEDQEDIEDIENVFKDIEKELLDD